MTPILHTTALQKRFGGLIATNDVTLAIHPGARQALIGPNGAGKTTFINLLTGTIRPTLGQVFLAGEDITRLSPEARVRRGLVRTFQVNQLFPGVTPRQAVTLAVLRRAGRDANPLRALSADRDAARDTAAILERFGLAGPPADTATRELPYGLQRLLEIALAIACGPRVLLLDEPAAGVPEGERAGILAGIAALPPDVAVLLIEHDMDLVFRFATRIAVMAGGRLLTEGTPAEVAADPRVREVYLGTEAPDDGDAG